MSSEILAQGKGGCHRSAPSCSSAPSLREMRNLQPVGGSSLGGGLLRPGSRRRAETGNARLQLIKGGRVVYPLPARALKLQRFYRQRAINVTAAACSVLVRGTVRLHVYKAHRGGVTGSGPRASPATSVTVGWRLIPVFAAETLLSSPGGGRRSSAPPLVHLCSEGPMAQSFPPHLNRPRRQTASQQGHSTDPQSAFTPTY
ncbi:hypothetical protein SKAU_G00143410 [Synaphobranchus kaupii]|uniref:Uncharacterized protein n=1 Tax=Synaphobranchus kaupii TaxID=118154 RepID=A0A9Q1J4M1_SYNKA|nr:hypothetical protein SKAU_G00143410 [Synaphobranchus kaupii]